MSERALERHHVFLIPGFFGFAELGGITYFHHIREVLTALLRARGIEPNIVYVDTLPTASIRKRAARLCAQIEATASGDDAPIHLIGHSTGGLDARLFASPTVALHGDADPEPFARRLQSVVTVAAPHLGTPLAFFFNSLLGEHLLFLLSMVTIYALRFGRFPLSTLFTIIGVLARLDDRLGWRDTILDQFYENLFADFNQPQMQEITEFLQSIREDRTLLGQLTPGGIDLLNAATEDRAGVRYGCVVTQARAPELRSIRDVGANPYFQTSHMIYRAMHWLTSFVPNYPRPEPEVIDHLVRVFGAMPPEGASDGVVPTWSQLHGELIHAVWADHLDVCGHFSEAGHEPPHVDWLASGTHFTRERFDALWTDIADFMTR